jgi:GTP:adenosylcobinamide-phosphate guanylyltransferase
VEEKATLTIHDQPMLDWVVNAFHGSPEVNHLVVVGSGRLDTLRSMAHVRKRIPQGVNVVQNLLHAVGYIKTRFYRDSSDHQGYVITFCDAVFLTPDIVTDTLRAIREADADIVMHYVERGTFEAAGLPAERTYIPIGNGLYTGTTIYYVKRFTKVLSSLDKLATMRKNRKDPHGILRVIGCEGQNFPDIENALSKHLDAKVRILISPHAEMGMDVDKPSDYALARKRLLQPDL